MKKLCFGVLLLYAQVALAGKTTCFSDSRDGIAFQYCTQNGIEFDHTHVLWYIHAKGETASNFLDSGQLNYAALNQNGAEQQLRELENQIQQAAGAAGNRQQQQLQQALNQTSETLQNAESLQQIGRAHV